MTSMPPEGRRSMRSIEPVMTTGGEPSSGSRVSSKSSSSSERLAEAADLALPEVVEQGRDSPLVALLGRLVAEVGRHPARPELALEVLAGGRRVAARGPLAALLGERLERLVGGRPERERRDRLVGRRHPVDVAERVLERARVVRVERRVAVRRRAAARPGAGSRRRRSRARASGRSADRAPGRAPRRPSSRPTERRRQLRLEVVAGGRGLRVVGVGRLHEPDELARPQAQREPALAGGRQRHDPPDGRDLSIDVRRRSASRRRPSSPSCASFGRTTSAPSGRSGTSSTPAPSRISPTNRDASFAAAGPPCVVRISRSCARVIATYSSRRSSSVWMSPAGTASRSSSRGKKPPPCSFVGHSPSSRLGTKTIGNSSPFAW